MLTYVSDPSFRDENRDRNQLPFPLWQCDRLCQGEVQPNPPTATCMTTPHIPVLLTEVLKMLKPKAGDTVLDGTFGAGGYSRAILEAGASRVIGLDRDPTAIEAGKPLVSHFGDRLSLFHTAFSELGTLAAEHAPTGLDAIVLDIGVSSMQIDQAERGFSFQADGPLDMRMACEGLSAADLVNNLSERELAQVIYIYGEEKRSRRIAKAIVERRRERRFDTTADLANFLQSVLGRGPQERTHPATRTFQALRIAVNRELDELTDALAAAEAALKPGGRLVVVTFHSLEDRIVKRFLAERSGKTGGGSRHLPETSTEQPTFALLSRKSIEATPDEIARNPRARSARLRGGERLHAPKRELNRRELGLPQLGFDCRESALS